MAQSNETCKRRTEAHNTMEINKKEDGIPKEQS